jgi:hypothetical protein
MDRMQRLGRRETTREQGDRQRVDTHRLQVRMWRQPFAAHALSVSLMKLIRLSLALHWLENIEARALTGKRDAF